MSQTNSAVIGTDRRAHIEAKLAAYPHIDEATLAEVIGWFRKEASAHDVAMVASNEAIAGAYRSFRADHIDPLTGRDVIKGILFIAAIGLAMALIYWRTLL